MAKKLKPDFKKDLETAAKQMILIRRVDTLIRLILRTISRNLKVKHAVLLLYDRKRDDYVANVSRGKEGLKIPTGLTKVKKTNPLIRYFSESHLKVFGEDFLLLDKINSFLKSRKGKRNKELKKLLEGIQFQFSLYSAKACIAGFFRNQLICLFFLGPKLNRRPFTKEELGFLSVLSSDAVMAIQNAWFFQDLNHQLELHRNLFLQTVLALASAIEAKDKYTMGHTDRVSKYSLVVAEELKKMRKVDFSNWNQFLDDLRIASLLHDIGKIGVPEGTLNKNGALDNKGWSHIKKHPLVGFSILDKIDEFQVPVLGVKYHHERWDGKGYPEGLKGDSIPLIAQVIAIADTYDAMATDRPYRKGMPQNKIVQLMKKEKGKQFSPIIVDAFLRACAKCKLQ